MLNIIFDPHAIEPHAGTCEDLTAIRTDRLRFTVGTTEYTITGTPDGFTVVKVNHSNPLQESVVIQPVHTNKIKIT